MTYRTNKLTVNAWAKGKEDGKAKGGNIFFEGDRIWSYGRHYLMAKKLGNDFVLLKENKYSNTTSQHRGLVRRAIGSSATIIEVPCVDVKDDVVFGGNNRFFGNREDETRSQTGVLDNLDYLIKQVRKAVGSFHRARKRSKWRRVASAVDNMIQYLNRFNLWWTVNELQVLSDITTTATRMDGVPRRMAIDLVPKLISGVSHSKAASKAKSRRLKREEKTRENRRRRKKKEIEQEAIKKVKRLTDEEVQKQFDEWRQGQYVSIDFAARHPEVWTDVLNYFSERVAIREGTEGFEVMRWDGRGIARPTDEQVMRAFIMAHERREKGEGISWGVEGFKENYPMAAGLPFGECAEELNLHFGLHQTAEKQMAYNINKRGDLVQPAGNDTTLPFCELLRVAENKGWVITDHTGEYIMLVDDSDVEIWRPKKSGSQDETRDMGNGAPDTEDEESIFDVV